MAPSLKDTLLNPPLHAPQLRHQNLRMRHRDQIIRRAMNDQDPLPTHLVRNLLQLLRALFMVPGSESLADEALAGEAVDVLALGEFLGGEAVAVGGEVAVLVGLGEPGGADAGLDFGDLLVDGFGDAGIVNGGQPAPLEFGLTRY